MVAGYIESALPIPQRRPRTKTNRPKPESARQLEVFEYWYSHDCNTYDTSKNCAIGYNALNEWIDRHGWRQRAHDRIAAIQRQSDADAIKRRTKLIDNQRKIAEAAYMAGAAYLQDAGRHAAKDARDAALLISKGFELARQAEEIPVAVMQILHMSDADLIESITQSMRQRAIETDVVGDAVLTDEAAVDTSHAD